MDTALELTQSLHGTWHGTYGMAPCPICQPERRIDQKALSISEDATGRLLAHCHKSGCAFRDIRAAAGTSAPKQPQRDFASIERHKAAHDNQAERKAQSAKFCWQQAHPIPGTPAETYLREVRGLSCALPDTLRFHPACYHGPSGQQYPALIALVHGGGSFAIHRTFLARDGSGKAPVTPQKMMLGACRGGVVRLAQVSRSVMIGEGLETCLAAMQLFGLPAWAALSAVNMPKIRLPAQIQHVTLLADGDEAGRSAARASALRLAAQGRQVKVHSAPKGLDFNDVLLRDHAKTEVQ